MVSLGIALEEKPNFAFEWLHWVINSALAFDPKEIGCNSVMFRVELQRSGGGAFSSPEWLPTGKPSAETLQLLLVSDSSLCLPGLQLHWAGRTRLPRSDLYSGSMYTVAPGT